MVKILLLEDDVIDQMSFERLVKREALPYSYLIIDSIATARATLLKENFDLIISDYNLADGTAFELLEYFKSTPFIITTGGGGEETAVKALRAGAYDYVVKDHEGNYLKILPITIEKALTRKRTETQLQLLQAVVVNANDAILITQPETPQLFTIQYANEAFTHLTGFSQSELIGQPLSILFPTKQAEQQNLLLDAFHTNKPMYIQFVNENKQGVEYWVDVNTIPIFDDDQRVVNFVAIHRDITQQKNTEHELMKAKQKAELAQAAEKQFLANMSHEIRTPMNAVIGMTELLLESKPNAKQLEYLKPLKFAADNLLNLINDILDLSKIESEGLSFEKVPFNFRELLESLRSTFEFKMLDKKNVKLIFNCDDEIQHELLGDATRLTQILMNLLSNAGKFTQIGKIVLTAKIQKQESDLCWILLSVEDTGIGISPDKLEIIFDKFKQADNSIHRHYGGTGLGLAIVKELVEKQGGNIKVTSKINEGTLFEILLPFQIIQRSSHVPSSPTEVAIVSNLEVSDLAILVVEDNLMNQKLVSLVMEQWNAKFDLAENGLEALQKCKHKAYDIILMDIQMPLMNGYEAAAAIRDDVENLNRQTPIVALTATVSRDEKRSILESGMNDFLPKPYTPNKLKHCILSNVKFKPKSHNNQETKISSPVPFNHDFDFKHLAQTFSGNHQFLREMIDLFLQTNPDDLNTLQLALQQQNWELAFKTAHKLKSNYSMMGMTKQEQFAISIEKATKSTPDAKDIATLEADFEQLFTTSKMIYPQLKKELFKYNKI